MYVYSDSFFFKNKLNINLTVDIIPTCGNTSTQTSNLTVYPLKLLYMSLKGYSILYDFFDILLFSFQSSGKSGRVII